MNYEPKGLLLLVQPLQKKSKILRIAASKDSGEIRPLLVLKVGPGKTVDGHFLEPSSKEGDIVMGLMGTGTEITDDKQGTIMLIPDGVVLATITQFNKSEWEPLNAEPAPLIVPTLIH
jgi:co-chaperonin GroES (HSP10)